MVEKGFVRIHVNDIPGLKEKYVVQELPSKLVYTVKHLPKILVMDQRPRIAKENPV